jgi:hypothetical protein
MSYATAAESRVVAERGLLSALSWTGPSGVASLSTTPFAETWFTGPRRLAWNAVLELAQEPDSSGPFLPEVVAAKIRPIDPGAAAVVEAELMASISSEAPPPGAVKHLAGTLADLVAAGKPAPAHGTAVLSASDIFATLPPINWTCQALDVAPGPPLLVAGYGYSGKTLAAQDLALAVATGGAVWGAFPARPGRVLHLDYEQGMHLTCTRYQRLARARGIDPATLSGRLMLAPFPGWYLDGDTNDELLRLCEGVDVVIVDSFRAACPRTEENSSEARVPIDRLTRISEKTGVTGIVIHHARKPSRESSGGARMSIRGSGALYDACGSVLVFSGEKGEPPTVAHEKAKITGRLHPDFCLQIEDVEIDGDPKGGLRVAFLSAPVPQARPTPSDRFSETKDRVLALVRSEGTVAGGVNLIRSRLGLRKDDVGAAVEALVQAGAIYRGGSKRDPTLSLAGDARAQD